MSEETTATTQTTETESNPFANLFVETPEETAAPQVEAKTETVTEEKKSLEGETPLKDESLTVRDSFSSLAKSEKKARELREKLESERKAFESEKGNYLTKDQVKALLEENGILAAKEFGIEPDSLIKRHFANDGKDPEFQIQELKKEIESLRNMTKEEKAKELEERVKNEEKIQEQNITQFKSVIKDTVTKAGEKYEFLSDIQNFEDQVFEAWFQIGQKIGTPPSLDEVLTKMNAEAEKLLETQVKNAKSLPKLLKKLGMFQEKQAEDQKDKSMTLNSFFPTSAPEAPKADDSKRIPTDEERMRDAIAALQQARSG